jgi:hypothetical protein
MTIEDQLREAGRAVTEQVRDLPKLVLPPAWVPTRSGARRPRGLRWPTRSGWLIPLAAAVAVIAVAGILVATRTLHAATSPAASSPASQKGPAVGGPNAIPRYFVALTPNHAEIAKTADVVDSRSGKLLAKVSVPAGGSFSYVGGGDDRTFVLADTLDPDSLFPVGKTPLWAGSFDLYQLRVVPGAAHPAQLTKLPIAAVTGAVAGIAVSPDDREVAVESVTSHELTLAAYSLASGSSLGTWAVSTDPGSSPTWGVSWLADGRHVAVTIAVGPPGSAVGDDFMEVRTLNVYQPSGSLLADSRLDLRLPYSQSCSTTLLSPDGETFLCGLEVVPVNPPINNCNLMGPELLAYSVRTGKIVRVLYRNRSECGLGVVVPLWANPSARDVIALLEVVILNEHQKIGLFANGRFTGTSYPFFNLITLGAADVAF